jgi:LPS sulfotransferase NodH
VTEPNRSYLVAASQRSGTTLLCRALAATGVAGNPDEYFLAVDDEAMPGWSTWEDGPYGQLLGSRDRADFLRGVLQLGTTPNGVFGAKLMWNNVPSALAKLAEVVGYEGLGRAEALHRLLPGLCLVHVVRRDRVAQAVSWMRASQDEIWVAPRNGEPQPPSAEPHYDPALIAGLLGIIERSEHGWRALASDLGVEPLEVTYEELTTPDTYTSTVLKVVEHVAGAGAAKVAVVPPPPTVRQADEQNRRWARRFRMEHGVE